MSRPNNHHRIWHSMSHAQSLLFLCLTSSAHSTRTPKPTSLMFPSHGDDHCDDPRHGATFGQLVQSNTLTKTLLRRVHVATLVQEEDTPLHSPQGEDSDESVAASLPSNHQQGDEDNDASDERVCDDHVTSMMCATLS